MRHFKWVKIDHFHSDFKTILTQCSPRGVLLHLVVPEAQWPLCRPKGDEWQNWDQCRTSGLEPGRATSFHMMTCYNILLLMPALIIYAHHCSYFLQYSAVWNLGLLRSSGVLPERVEFQKPPYLMFSKIFHIV